MKYSNGNLDYVFNPQSDTFNDPVPILQQQKASLTTNPFIKPKETHEETNEPQTETPKMNTQISITFIGLLDDCLNKPDDIEWKHYAPIILQKDNRFTYLLVLVIFFIMFILLLI